VLEIVFVIENITIVTYNQNKMFFFIAININFQKQMISASNCAIITINWRETKNKK
jgi:hypothetical protein